MSDEHDPTAKLMRLASECRQRGDVESALAILSGLINISPSAGEALLQRGLCHADMEEWAFARDDLDKAACVLQDPGPALLAKARVLMRCGRLTHAWACLERARRGGTRTKDLYELRARILELRGDEDAAREERGKAESLGLKAATEQEQVEKYAETLSNILGGKVMGVWWTGGEAAKTEARKAHEGGVRPACAVALAPINVAIHPERMPHGLKVKFEVSCEPDVASSPGRRADPTQHPPMGDGG